MGFLKQDTPQIDFDQWSKGARAEKIMPMARHWAEVGFGTPVLLHLFYVAKIALYVLAAWLLTLTTRESTVSPTSRLVRRADRVREGRALHDALRGRRPRLRFGPEQPVLPADGVDPVLAAPRHHPAATVAGSGSADQGESRTPFEVLLYAALMVVLGWRSSPTALGRSPAWGRSSVCFRRGRSGPLSGFSRSSVCGTR